MCAPSAPNTPPPIPIPPPPPGAPIIDQQILDARNVARQQARSRAGRESTILAGDTAATPPTTQSKQLLGG